ncbi:hypothetical protein CCP3SC15_1130002 [Gammaproteobacteria bacterium]
MDCPHPTTQRIPHPLDLDQAPPGSQLCPECSLAVRYCKCDAANRLTARYCTNCGKRLRAAKLPEVRLALPGVIRKATENAPQYPLDSCLQLPSGYTPYIWRGMREGVVVFSRSAKDRKANVVLHFVPDLATALNPKLGGTLLQTSPPIAVGFSNPYAQIMQQQKIGNKPETNRKNLTTFQIGLLNKVDEWILSEIGTSDTMRLGDAINQALTECRPVTIGGIQIGQENWTNPLLETAKRLYDAYGKMIDTDKNSQWVEGVTRYDIIRKTFNAHIKLHEKGINIEKTSPLNCKRKAKTAPH